MPEDRPFRRTESLGYQVNHLARLLAQALRDRIEAHGVLPGQFAQLLALYEEDGITQHQLCERVRIDQSTMAHTLNRMERDGLVRRQPDPADRRRALISLTPRARALRPEFEAAATEVNDRATEGMSTAERTAALGLVTRMITALETRGPVNEEVR